MNENFNQFLEKYKVINPLPSELTSRLRQSPVHRTSWSTLLETPPLINNYYSFIRKVMAQEIQGDFASISLSDYDKNSLALCLHFRVGPFLYFNHLKLNLERHEDYLAVRVREIFETFSDINRQLYEEPLLHPKLGRGELYVLMIDRLSFSNFTAVTWIKPEAKTLDDLEWEVPLVIWKPWGEEINRIIFKDNYPGKKPVR